MIERVHRESEGYFWAANFGPAGVSGACAWACFSMRPGAGLGGVGPGWRGRAGLAGIGLAGLADNVLEFLIKCTSYFINFISTHLYIYSNGKTQSPKNVYFNPKNVY